MSYIRQHPTSLEFLECVAAVTAAASGFVFVSLVVGNYLVFSSSVALQSLGSHFLIPVYYFSVVILRWSPFDEGLWAFAAFCFLLLSLSALRTRTHGAIDSVVDSLTLVGPAILACFEAGVYLFIPQYFYAQVTNFVGAANLGSLVTNCFVLISSITVLSGRMLFKIGKFKLGRGGNLAF